MMHGNDVAGLEDEENTIADVDPASALGKALRPADESYSNGVDAVKNATQESAIEAAHVRSAFDEGNKEDKPHKSLNGTENDHGKASELVRYNSSNEEVSLEDGANFFSTMMMSYLTPLLRYGSKKVLDVDDINVPSKQDRAEETYVKVKCEWEKELKLVAAKNKRYRELHEAKLNVRRREIDEDEQHHPASGELNGVNGASKKRKPKELDGPKWIEPSLSMVLLRSFGIWATIHTNFLLLISSLLNFVPIIILTDLTSYFEGAKIRYGNPWVDVVGLAIFPVIVSLLQNRNNVVMQHLAVHARTGCSMLLYEKSLCISPSGKSRTSTGQVVNMMSNDTNQIMRFLQFANQTFIAPVQIVISLVLIFKQVGNATWVGVGFMIFLAPVNAVVFKLVGTLRRNVLRFSDLRVKMVNDVLGGIRIIKYYAWERAFGEEIGKIRKEELKVLTRLTYATNVGFSIILLSAPIIQIILVFFTYINIQTKPLTASVAFTTVALFNMMRVPFAILPMGFLQYIQAMIAVRRIASFLQLPELNSCVVYSPHPDYANDSIVKAGEDSRVEERNEGSITMKNCSFAWVDPSSLPGNPLYLDERRSRVVKKEKESRQTKRNRKRQEKEDAQRASANKVDTESASVGDGIILHDLSCDIKAGSLVAVVGEVGSGKSSFLSAILGEMEAIGDTKVYISRDDGKSMMNFMAYCTQSPWVVNDTVRGNVVFGRSFDQDRYDEVVSAAALADDLLILHAGDLTEIGERGINLSGGQKARVCLARAMYSRDTKILLLDDPLSAVDAHVGEHLFNKAITGKISSGMTRILVTHHVQFLPRCDSVIIMEDGRIVRQGKYEDLVADGVDFSSSVDSSRVSEELKKLAPAEMYRSVSAGSSASEIEGDTKGHSRQSTELSTSSPDAEDDGGDLRKKGLSLMTVEGREEGAVAGSAYYHYASIGGMCLATFFLIAQASSGALDVGSSFWLAHWSDESVAAVKAKTTLSNGETSFNMGIYALLGLLGVVALAGRGIFMALHRMHACRRLHEDMTKSVLRAPVSFFDITPTGRVLNRFAHDTDKIDLQLVQSLSQGFNTVSSLLGALAAIVAATKGIFVIPLIPIVMLMYKIQRWFRRSSTELQRITSMTNSPIFANFSQTLTGTATIRAYGEEGRFFSRCKKEFDKNNSAYILVQLVGYWLGLRLDCLGGLVSAFVAALAVGTISLHFIPAGWLGLALSYSINVTNNLKLSVRMMATLEADMSSVERVLDYANNIVPEAPDVVPGKDPEGKKWPSSGTITVNQASMRYRDGPLVLKKLSFTVEAGEKIGVVGRTGSGKSSLMTALFRITEIEKDGGVITIDGVNISEIGTKTLRSNLSIIPQDPVLFSNTVRYNLDPFGESTDEELWSTLTKVQLSGVIAALPNKLDEWVAEGGENFSQGQRQLLCIGRSVLRNPRILVMDEATASIDNTTDAAIQSMIRENFRNATVLTIAHRLNTIMDSDKVLVLNDGKVAEYDSPSNLLANKKGLFAELVKASRESGK